MKRILAALLVLLLALCCLSLLNSALFLASYTHTTVKPLVHKPNDKGHTFNKTGLRVNQDRLTVLVASAVESKFETLKVHECQQSIPSKENIEWNNTYWQKVSGRNIFLYSAHYDARFVYQLNTYHYVRVIGMSIGKLKPEEKYYCSLWYNHINNPIVVEAEVKEVWVTRWNKDATSDAHHAYMFVCPVPLDIQESKSYTEYVSISSDSCGLLTNLLPVQRKGLIERRNGKLKKKYAICVKGLDLNEDYSIRLVEWIEMNFILGADKIFMYQYRVHPNVSLVLDYYIKKGKVEVIPLTLPGTQPNDPEERSLYIKRQIWQKRRNEIVPYNDCLYKNLYTYNFIIPLDIDEVIVPVNAYNWPEMFGKIFKEDPNALKKYSSFSVQNAYFFNFFTQTESNLKIPEEYHMLRHTIRSANFSLYGHSVKSFVSTKTTLTVFNHYTLEGLYYKVKPNQVLPSSMVQLNHYKARCPRDMFSQCRDNFLVYKKEDPLILKYKEKLMENVKNVLQ
ncbi:unnamed protein product, partial [Meganyctiphanes norvegica]